MQELQAYGWGGRNGPPAKGRPAAAAELDPRRQHQWRRQGWRAAVTVGQQQPAAEPVGPTFDKFAYFTSLLVFLHGEWPRGVHSIAPTTVPQLVAPVHVWTTKNESKNLAAVEVEVDRNRHCIGTSLWGPGPSGSDCATRWCLCPCCPSPSPSQPNPTHHHNGHSH